MGKGGQDMFPQPGGGSVLPPHLSSFARVQESIDAAVVGVRQIAGHAFGEPRDELTYSGDRLAASLTYLRDVVTSFAARQPETTPKPESGFDETKLLASIEKWQRRYQELEGEYANVEGRLLELETENEQLAEQCYRLREARDEVMMRIERTMEIVDTLLEDGDDDEEYRNYH